MGYQALLFCPDEKTARTVTQVLTELDFTVIPCTEPFAAVKKLMGEHFDAVVVDCDNEQNATLLFKSARNTTNNQSALAVAVVEGQAGVAKAFRIGANLVLTKPINVEQAKGTLRVARGLLRKNEAGKPATPAASTPVKPAASVAAPPKPAPQAPSPAVSTARPAAPIAPLAKAATASIATPAPAAPPRVVASVPSETADSDAEILDLDEEIASPSTLEHEIKTAPKPGVPAPVLGVGHSTIPGGFGTGAASAPAPARELQPRVAAEHESSSVIAEPESPAGKVAASGASVEETAASSSSPAPAFTFGGNVGSGSKSGGNKKALLAVAAVVLIAAGGYAAWTQWGHPDGPEVGPMHVATQSVTAPATPSRPAPSTTPAPASSLTASTASSTQPSAASSTASQPAGVADSSSESDTETGASAENAAHSSKASTKAGSAKPAASVAAPKKSPATPAAEQPIVIKNDVSKAVTKAAATPDVVAPSLAGIAPAGNGEALPNLMGGQSKAPIPVLQTLNVSQGVSQGLLVKRVQPTYPANALHMRVEGAVQIMATISKSGSISTVKVLKGDPTLARAAADAVKQWKYKPYLLNGEPVEIQTEITVNFKLPN
jgi:TonB family protein